MPTTSEPRYPQFHAVVLHHMPGYGSFRVIRVTNYVQDAVYHDVENAPY